MKKIGLKKSELQIETEILQWLNMQEGVFAFKVETRGFYDSNKGFYRRNRNKFVLKGTSDILAVFKGRFLAIEVKTPINMRKFKGNPGEHELNQIAFLSAVTQKKGLSICASSLDEVINYIESVNLTVNV